MKKLFPGFYNQNINGVRDYKEETTYIFDTNVLLNLFRYPDKSRELLLQILREISKKIFLPYQVAMEFHFNVMEEIITQNNAYDGLISSLNEKYEKMLEDFQKYAQRHSNLQMDDELLAKIKDSLDALVLDLEEQKRKHPDLYSLQEELSEIIQEVGAPYTKEELEELYEIGEERYKNKMPPGFKDQKKGDDVRIHHGIVYQNKYGDYILWRQILDYFSKEENKRKFIIFITDDNKSDWWKNFKGIRKPHPQLIQEFTKECPESRILIYTTKQFLRHASELIGLAQDAAQVDEAIASIDEYRKKKDISDFQEHKVSLTTEDIFAKYPFLEQLDADHKLIIIDLINIAENEEAIENAINWAKKLLAKQQINSISKSLSEDIESSTPRKWNRKGMLFDSNGYSIIDRKDKYINKVPGLNEDNIAIERVRVDDDYDLLQFKINDLKNTIMHEIQFLDINNQDEIITTFNAYDPINDLEFKYKKLKQLYAVVKSKRKFM